MKLARWLMGLGIMATLFTVSSPMANAAGNSQQKNYLLIGTDTGVDSLNPLVGLAQDSYNMWEQIYPQLVQYNPKGLSFVADFGKSWTHSANELTWTFQTTPNAKWSDGKPLTAKDVAWTYNTIIKFKASSTASLAGGVTNMASAVATSSNTVVIKYSKPTSDVLANLQQLPILPEHVWAKYAVGKGAGLKTFPNKPTPGNPVVSGGPFMNTSFVLNQQAIFLANPNFYGPKPHISGFGLQVFSNDDAMVEALKTGQIDAIENVPVTSVKVIKAAGFDVYVGPSLTWRDLIINPVQNKTTDRELLNPNVRKAFEYAVDRKTIVKTAWLGYATPAASAIPPATGIWHDPAIQPLPFNLTLANHLLDQAGYKKGSNGIRTANGHPMSYQVIFSSDQNGPGDRAFQIIQTDFRKIGVQLTQQVLDPAATQTAITANNYRTYNLAMWFWVPLIDPSLMISAYTCGQYDSWNDSGLCTPALDKLYQEQSSALSLKERVKLVYQAQVMIYNSRAEIALVNNDVIDAWSSKWTGFVETPQGFFNQLSKIDLEQVRLK